MLSIHPGLINFVRPSEHSTYSPSSMDRLIACPASIRICKDIPQEAEQDYSREGTLAHSYAEAAYYSEMLGMPIAQSLVDEVVPWKSAGDIVNGALMYVKEIRDWLGNPEVGQVLWYGLEKGVPIFPEEGAFGTGDCVIVGSRSAVIIDYKFGKKKVYADSKQLKAYAAGVLRYLQDVPEDYRIYTVIVQPRVDVAASVHCYSVDEIRDFLAIIQDMIVRSKDPNALPNRGDKKHCFWCPASRTSDPQFRCPAIKAEQMSVADEDFRGYLRVLSEPVTTLSISNPERDQALIKLVAMAPAVAHAASEALKEFEFRIEAGETIPGVFITTTEGNRKWANNDADTWNALAQRFPECRDKLVKEVPATVKLKSIGEIEKLVGKDKLNELTVKPIGKKVVLSEDEQMKYSNFFINHETSNDEQE